MALIKCPECGKEISSKAASCPNCGCPASEFAKTQVDYVNPTSDFSVVNPQKKDNNEHSEENKVPFTGVYRTHLFGKREEVYCPICGSANCSIYREQRVIPGKSKTSYTMNLNPLKPFTLFNKKEKVIKQDRVVTENKFMCNSCGHIFR